MKRRRRAGQPRRKDAARPSRSPRQAPAARSEPSRPWRPTVTSPGVRFKAVGAVIGADLLVSAAEPPAAPLVFEQRLKILRLAEVRPERRRHVKFGVGDLPEEKIADAHLAA